VIKFLEVTELNDKDQFLELGREWTEVLKSSRDDNVFYAWEWLSTWWENFHEGELLILLVRSKKRIFGIAPLMCVKQRLMRTFNLKMLQFLGTGISDYSNFIVRKEEEVQCLATMIEYLNKCSKRWSFLNLREIPLESEYVHVIRKAFSHELTSRISSTCKYIPIPRSMKLLENNLAGTARRSLRRTLRRLEEEHKIEFHIISDLDSAKDGLKTFTKLHEKQWSSKKSTGEHALPNKDFLNDIVKIFASKGWLNLSFLNADGIAISSCLGFEYGNKLYGYITSFDPEYGRFGPGQLHIKFLIEYCIRNGLRELDLLRGQEPYKSKWNPCVRKNVELTGFKKRFFNTIYEWISEVGYKTRT
jgi:CelD/BcsL family acetyltransferase involved in cellulose biosynthesis